MGKNVFIDIDGTLVNYKNELPDSAFFALKEAKKNNHRIILCTGRTRFKIPKDISNFEIDGLIAGNGCYIEAENHVILDKTLSLKDCTDIVDWLTERNIGFYHNCSNKIYANETFRQTFREVMKIYSNSKSEEELEAYLKRGFLLGAVYDQSLYRADVEKIDYILHTQEEQEELKARFPHLCHGQWGGVGDRSLFGDVSVPGVNKGTAIRLYEEHENLDHRDSIGIGDALSDIPMIQMCEIGVAMGNSPDYVKGLADFVTNDVDQDGLLIAFKALKLI